MASFIKMLRVACPLGEWTHDPVRELWVAEGHYRIASGHHERFYVRYWTGDDWWPLINGAPVSMEKAVDLIGRREVSLRGHRE